jgi:hypothetical protein
MVLQQVLPTEVEGVDRVIEALYIAAQMRSALEHEIQLLVAEARSREVPWSVIGKHFGITRQAAQQRFGAPMNTDTIRKLSAERKEALDTAKWRVEDRGKRDESFWEARQLIDRLDHFRA